MAREANKLPTIFFCYPALESRGGAEKILRDLALHFSSKFRVFVLSGDSSRAWKSLDFPEDIRHRFVPCGDRNILKAGLSLAFLAIYLLLYKPALVHSHHRRLTLLFSALKGRIPVKFRLLHTSHNVFHTGKLFGRARCDRLTGVSRAVVKNLTEDFRFDAGKVDLIHNGIEELQGNFTPARENAAVVVARLMRQKGHIYAIRAWAEVVKKVPSASLYIVGEGELKPELERLVRELGLSDRIFFPGFSSDPRAWMQKTKFGILPSLWEGLPLFPLEAFSVKRTVVATAVDGTPEIVIDGKTGLLVPPEDVSKLAEAVVFMFRNEEARDKMAEEGHRMFKETFTREAMLRQYEECYDDLMR